MAPSRFDATENRSRAQDSNTTSSHARMPLYREPKILIPGPFVVFQGNDGDGLSNTVDGSLPFLPRRRRVRQPRVETNVIQERSQTESQSSVSSPHGDEEFQHVPSTTTAHSAARIVNGPRFAVTAGVVAAAAEADQRQSLPSSTSSSLDEFIVVGSGPLEQEDPRIDEDDLEAINNWKDRKRQMELQQQQDWELSLYQVPPTIVARHTMMTPPPVTQATNDPQSTCWWQRGGEVAILRELPTKVLEGSVTVSRIGTLAPGSTVMALDLIELHSATLLPVRACPRRRGKHDHRPNESITTVMDSPQQSVHLQGRPGIIQLIQVKTIEGTTGYVCLSLDGYPLLGPGLPSTYVNPSFESPLGGWIWRVTCPSGAFVREGLDLHSKHTQTLPYGSLIRITRRCINHQGLSRLRTSGYIAKDSDTRERIQVEGWCSELLNPLSGQRGIVAQPLPFPVPAVYRVTLPMGAVIRQDIELSSPQTGLAPFGSLLKVIGRAFSEHPIDQCIERLRLAGNRGWISVRLNRPPPEDDLVVELVDVDGDFDPESPGVYHIQAQREVQAERENSDITTRDDLSSVDEDEAHDDDDDAEHQDEGANGICNAGNGASDASSKCVVCLTSNRNATIVHGETGHVVCCLVCARILKARGDKCPVCRLDIDLVIQHFYA